MVRLKEIAEQAGVSRMTVSLALRGDPRIAAETRERVRAIARKLGYRPNPQVSTLMSAVAKTRHTPSGEHLAFITSHSSEWGWKKQFHPANYFEGAAERALEYGYELEPFWLLDKRKPPEKTFQAMWSRGIKGCLIAPLGPRLPLFDGQRTLPLDWTRFSLVALDETIDAPVLHQALHGHFNGILLLLHKLETLGYRRIGLTMSRRQEFRTRHRWYAAYMLWRKTRGLEELPAFFYDEVDGAATLRWIRDNRIDAVAAVEQVLHDQLCALGLEIPGEVGFAVLDRPAAPEFPLSGINQNSKLIGQSAIDILVGLVRRGERGAPSHPSQWVCIGDWVPAGSTRPVGPPLDERPLYDRALSF